MIEWNSSVYPAVSDSVTQWTVASQAPLSMGFFGKNTGVGCHFLLQEIFLTQGLNPFLAYPAVELKPVKLLGENIGDHCYSLGLDNNFLDGIQKNSKAHADNF